MRMVVVLPASVGADEGEGFAGSHLEVQSVQGQPLVVPVSQSATTDHGTSSPWTTTKFSTVWRARGSEHSTPLALVWLQPISSEVEG